MRHSKKTSFKKLKSSKLSKEQTKDIKGGCCNNPWPPTPNCTGNNC